MIMCPKCYGTGGIPDPDVGREVCDLCQGKGEVTRRRHVRYQAIQKRENFFLMALAWAVTLLYFAK